MVTSRTTGQRSNEVRSKGVVGVRLFLPKEIPKTELYGYDLEVEAGLGLGLSVVKGGEKRALVFGLPGSGVGTFPRAIAWNLNASCDIPFSLLRVRCEDIILEHEVRQAVGNLLGFEEKIEANRPVVIHIQRPEALSKSFENFHKTKAFTKLWLSTFLGRRHDKALIICTTDNPKYIDFSLLKSFKIPIYLSSLDSESVRRILCTFFDREDCDKIARQLHQEMRRDGFELVSAEVVNACRETAKSIENFNELPVDEAVAFLRKNIFPCYPSDHVSEYQELNSGLISFSKEVTLDYWPRKFKEFKKGKK